MTKRTFKASELVAMGLPDDPQETMSIVSDVLCGHKRWSVVHELTFRLPGQPEGEAWRVYYNVPATESQEEAPWGYEEGGTYDPDVTATLVRLAPCVHCGKPAEHRAGKDPVCWPPCAHYTAWLRAALADPDMMPWPTRSRRSRHEMMLREAIVDAMRALRGDANPNARPETGPMRFADDWSGIFLRGDYACPMVFALDAALTAMADGKAPSPITIAQLRGLGRVLASCNEGDGEPANVQQMRLFAACVEPSKGNDQ